jgi:hypothetical protein
VGDQFTWTLVPEGARCAGNRAGVQAAPYYVHDRTHAQEDDDSCTYNEKCDGAGTCRMDVADCVFGPSCAHNPAPNTCIEATCTAAAANAPVAATCTATDANPLAPPTCTNTDAACTGADGTDCSGGTDEASCVAIPLADQSGVCAYAAGTDCSGFNGRDEVNCTAIGGSGACVYSAGVAATECNDASERAACEGLGGGGKCVYGAGSAATDCDDPTNPSMCESAGGGGKCVYADAGDNCKDFNADRICDDNTQTCAYAAKGTAEGETDRGFRGLT